MDEQHGLRAWGIIGGVVAAVFAIWLIVLPDSIATVFAWDVHPRPTQLFVAAGYLFRTAFFFAVAFAPSWRRVRWIFWGNLAFTGTLLLATYLNADQFHWAVLLPPMAHFWLILYIYEPVAMVYLVVGRNRLTPSAAAPADQPILPALRTFLAIVSGLFLMFGLFLLLNPALANTRWPWDLNPLDAQIMAAWFVGWALWTGTLALTRAWEDARLGVALLVLHGAVTIVLMAFALADFHFARRTTALSLVLGAVVITFIALVLFVIQERRVASAPRPSSAAPTAAEAVASDTR